MGTERTENVVPPLEDDPEGKPFDQVLLASRCMCYGVDYSADVCVQNDDGQSADSAGKGEQQ